MTLAIPALHRVPAAERGITIGDFLIPVRFGERISPRLRDIALVVAGAMLIALSSLVRIPVPGSPVPITGQTFAVLLVGGALGYRRGTLATLGYLLIGFFLPVYAGGASGPDTILSVDNGTIGLTTFTQLVGLQPDRNRLLRPVVAPGRCRRLRVSAQRQLQVVVVSFPRAVQTLLPKPQ